MVVVVVGVQTGAKRALEKLYLFICKSSLGFLFLFVFGCIKFLVFIPTICWQQMDGVHRPVSSSWFQSQESTLNLNEKASVRSFYIIMESSVFAHMFYKESLDIEV